MFLGMQEFGLSKFYLYFAQNLPKSKQICPSLTNFAQKNLLAESSAPMALS